MFNWYLIKKTKDVKITSTGPSLQKEHLPCARNSLRQISQQPPFGGPLRCKGSFLGLTKTQILEIVSSNLRYY